MKSPTRRFTFLDQSFPVLIAIICLAAWSLGASVLLGQQPQTQPQPEAQSQAMTSQEEAPKLPNDQLDSLVAPIALYPDPILAQVLAAATYPLEIIQLQQWMKNNSSLKDKALADAVAKLPYDPSVQQLAAFPDVLKQLSENVTWTTDLGNAFLAQQSDVMDAVQRMRAKAQGTGNLKTSAQQKVETESVGDKQVIVIEPANPQTVYVPQYSPTVVYGQPAYPYPYTPPPLYGALAFGAGIAMGAAWGGYWGNCNWQGGGDVTINNTNNFNKNNINNVNRGQQGGKWQHNAQHRGGAPYADRGTTNKYGGRGPGGAGGVGRPGGAGGAGGVGGAGRPGGAGGVGGAGRPGGVGGAGSAGRPGGVGGAGGAGGPGSVGGAGGAGRPGGGASTMPASRPSGGGGGAKGGDHVGSRDVSSGGGGAFGGGGGGNAARASSSRGSHSMGGGGGGGGRGGGGGGRGGGGGGGGRRR